jgi:hypothetical protein
MPILVAVKRRQACYELSFALSNSERRAVVASLFSEAFGLCSALFVMHLPYRAILFEPVDLNKSALHHRGDDMELRRDGSVLHFKGGPRLRRGLRHSLEDRGLLASSRARSHFAKNNSACTSITVNTRVLPSLSLMRTASSSACNQIVVALTIEAVSEALVLGSKAGVNPEKILEVLSGGLAANKVMEVKREKFLERDFEPGGKVEFHRKDLRIALEAGREYGVPLPVTALVCQMFEALTARERLGSPGAAHFYRGSGLARDSLACQHLNPSRSHPFGRKATLLEQLSPVI